MYKFVCVHLTLGVALGLTIIPRRRRDGKGGILAYGRFVLQEPLSPSQNQNMPL